MLIPPASLLLIVIIGHTLGQERPIVEITLGKIKGHYKQSYNGRTYTAYEGIPFAKPPIGELRFEEPVEAEPWSGVFDANIVHTCLQSSWMKHTPVGNEDCLYLNVYVPGNKTDDKQNLDVLVHIHGGAFMMGNPEAAGPLHLMDRNIVYVSMNYRLGVLGFLSTEDDVVPGNNGMKDQVIALRWVQKHIHRFGGNPNSVTITGVSAGAVAVHFHYFSPLSKGLFHRAISQGGTVLNSWALHEAPLQKTKQLAASIGCDNPCMKELIKCLKERSAIQVIKNAYDSPAAGFPLSPFAPVIERQSPGAFLTEHPYKLLKSGNINDVPWITGSTTEEGLLGLELLSYKYDDLNKRWDTVLPYVLDYYNTIAESDEAEIAQKIKKFYLNNKDISNDNIQSLIKLFSDRYFLVGLEKSVRMQAKVAKSSIYSYMYGYKRHVKLTVNWNPNNIDGVIHGSDANLLYEMKFEGTTIIKDRLPEPDLKITNFFLDTITSFAKDGKPILNDVTWEPTAGDGDFKYLLIHNDGIKMDSKKEIAHVGFWETLPLSEDDKVAVKKDEL